MSLNKYVKLLCDQDWIDNQQEKKHNAVFLYFSFIF